MKIKVIALCSVFFVSPTVFGMSLKDMLKEAAKIQAEKNKKESQQEQVIAPTPTETKNTQDLLSSEAVSNEKEDGIWQKEFWQDSNTGLTWRTCIVGSYFTPNNDSDRGYCETSQYGKASTWAEMILFVDELKLADHDDWRIPTQKEFSNLYSTDNAKRLSELGWVYLWTSTPSDKPESADEVVMVYSNKGEGGELKNISKDKGYKAYAYVVRGGVSDGTFENMVNVAKSDLIKKQKKDQELARTERQAQEKMALKAEQDRQAYYAKIVAFRKSVRVGDYTKQGLVIGIKDSLVKVQQYGKQCIEYSSNINSYNKSYDCLRMQKVVTGEAWIKRDEILPAQ